MNDPIFYVIAHGGSAPHFYSSQTLHWKHERVYVKKTKTLITTQLPAVCKRGHVDSNVSRPFLINRCSFFDHRLLTNIVGQLIMLPQKRFVSSFDLLNALAINL